MYDPGAMTTAAPHLPFADGKPFALRMGLQPLPAAQWIEIGEDYAAQLAAKRDLFAARHGDVVQVLPEAKAAAEEALQLLLDHLRAHHADRFAFAGDKLRNAVTGEQWDLAQSSLHPLEQAGRICQEDFCILQPDDKTGGEIYRLTAGAVCFPSNWRLADKIGKKLVDVHGPVPGYAEKLSGPVDRVFKNLATDTIMVRANWLIHATPELFQSGHRLDAAAVAAITPENAGEKLWHWPRAPCHMASRAIGGWRRSGRCCWSGWRREPRHSAYHPADEYVTVETGGRRCEGGTFWITPAKACMSITDAELLTVRLGAMGSFGE